MKRQPFEELIAKTAAARQADQAAAAAWQDRIVSQMIDAAHRETDRLEQHLLDTPLSRVIYQWVLLRLKRHPWKMLVPTALALSLLLQEILARFNLLQFLTH